MILCHILANTKFTDVKLITNLCKFHQIHRAAENVENNYDYNDISMKVSEHSTIIVMRYVQEMFLIFTQKGMQLCYV